VADFFSAAIFSAFTDKVELNCHFPAPASIDSSPLSTSETSAYIYQTTRRNIPEYSHLHIRRRENLKSHPVTTRIQFLLGPTSFRARCIFRIFRIVITCLKNLFQTYSFIQKAVSFRLDRILVLHVVNTL
jgi:hypothetical protein